MNKKFFVIIIFILFIGVSVTPSAKNISIEKSTLPILCEPFDESVVSFINFVKNEHTSEEILSRGKTAYAYIAYPGTSGLPEGPCFFDLDYPGTLTSFMIENCPDFLCGAWSNDNRWLVCDENGSLWEIDLCYKIASEIGGGGTVFYGLTYDPVNEKLYGTTGNYLYEIDLDTGNPTYIGNFGISTIMIDIACDIDGVCYGWDILFSGNSKLYTIDLDTGEATEYADMGACLSCVSSGSFDYETNTLYIAACCSSCGFLILYDFGNCEFSQIGNFQGCAYIGSLIIPYPEDICQPVSTHSFDPPNPDGESGWYVSNVTCLLTATDDLSGVKVTYYRINEEVWEIYKSPFVISEEGEDTLIEYYSVDNVGNVEDVKSACLNIDKTPPNMTVEWDVEKVGEGEWEVIFTIEIYNETSGVDRIVVFVNNGYQGTIPGWEPTYSWCLIIYGDLSLSIEFIAYDIAGNFASVIVNSTDINYLTSIKNIYSQQSKNKMLIRFFERFLLIYPFYNILEVEVK